jgi:hypothetical protein
MTDPAPTPWDTLGTSITDANGRLVAVLAGRLLQQRQVAAELAVAREMRQALEGLLDGMRLLVREGALTPAQRRNILEHRSVVTAYAVLNKIKKEEEGAAT